MLVALVLGQSAASLTGWTVQTNTNLASIIFLTILTRVVDGSEGASFTFTVTTPLQVGISRYSGVDTTTPVEGTPTQNASASSLTTTAASVTTVTAGAMLVHGVGWSSGSGTPASTPPGTMTERWEVAIGTPALVALNDETRASAGATGTRTSTITVASGGHTHAVLIALKPAATGVVVDAPAMGATYDMGAPTNAITQRGDAPAMTATYAMGVPTPVLTMDAPTMGATWDMGVPTYGIGATADAPAMAATWAMGVPTFTLSQVVDAPPMTFDLAMGDPTFSLTQRVDAPAMGAVWAMGEVTGGVSFPGVAWDGRAVVRRSGVRGSLHLNDPIDGDYGGVPGPVRGTRGKP